MSSEQFLTTYTAFHNAKTMSNPYVTLANRKPCVTQQSHLGPDLSNQETRDRVTMYAASFNGKEYPKYGRRAVSKIAATGFTRNGIDLFSDGQCDATPSAVPDSEYLASFRSADSVPNRGVGAGVRNGEKHNPQRLPNGYTRNEKYVPDQLGWRSLQPSIRDIAHLPEHQQAIRIKKDYLNYHGEARESVMKTSYSFAGQGHDYSIDGQPLNYPSMRRETVRACTVAERDQSGFSKAIQAAQDGVGCRSQQFLNQNAQPEKLGVNGNNVALQLERRRIADPLGMLHELRGGGNITSYNLAHGRVNKHEYVVRSKCDDEAAARAGIEISPLDLQSVPAGKRTDMGQLTGKDAGAGVATGAYRGTLGGIAGYLERKQATDDPAAAYKTTYQLHANPTLRRLGDGVPQGTAYLADAAGIKASVNGAWMKRQGSKAAKGVVDEEQKEVAF